MSEIESLKQDVAALKAAKLVIERHFNPDTSWVMLKIETLENEIERRLLRIKTNADPWHMAKGAVEIHIRNGGDRVKEVAKYAKHLEIENSNLRQEIEALKVERG